MTEPILGPVWVRRMRAYFEFLEAGDVERASRCFSSGVRYSRPPFRAEGPSAPRHEVVGRSALVALWGQRAGEATFHRLENWAGGGDDCFVAGSVLDLQGRATASFFAMASHDPIRDEFTSYAVLTSMPPLWSTI